MSIVKTIKNKLRFLKKNEYVLLVWNIRRVVKQKRFLKKYSDKEAVSLLYMERFNKKLNIDHPNTFTEKLQWLKLNYRTAEQTICVDKYAVRNYLKDKGYGNLLNRVIDIWDDVDNINIEKLPNKFVLKATHGSSMNLIVKDKTKINWFVWKKIMMQWLKQNIYIDGREWPYKNVRPQIICEEFIESNDNELKDYRIFCFNGEPEFIQVDIERLTSHNRTFFDKSWSLQPIKIGAYGKQHGFYAKQFDEEKPKQLDYMLKVSRELAAPFPFARIDFYNIENRVIFGEITFYPNSGFISIYPKEIEMRFGQKIVLPSTKLS